MYTPVHACRDNVIGGRRSARRWGRGVILGSILILTSESRGAEPALPEPVPLDVELPATVASDADRYEATSLASGDFDKDGVPDLAVGYSKLADGLVVTYRGNVDAIYPSSPEARARRTTGQFTVAPFYPDPRSFEVPVRPQLLVAGDFDADGHLDLVAATAGESAMTLLSGDGKGGFGLPESLSLPGPLTALAVGEINRADGLEDLAVGVLTAGGPRLLVFESPVGALRRDPEVLELPAEAETITLGRLEGDVWYDALVHADGGTVVVRGRDRRLLLGPGDREKVPPAEIEPIDEARTTEWWAAKRIPWATLPETGTRISAGLPMRLNADAREDWVVVVDGEAIPRVSLTTFDAVITVDSAADDLTPGNSECTLREAIANANADADTTSGDCVSGSGADAIAFSIGGGGATATIAVLSELPWLLDTVTLDGTTQGCPSPPCIALDGASAGTTAVGLRLSAASIVIRGMAIHGFGSHGIFATTSGNVFEGNHIGTDLTGTVGQGNGGAGVRLEGNLATGNAIGGPSASARNVISGNAGNGVFIYLGADDNQVIGNLIGTSAGGDAGLGNTWAGVQIEASVGNAIGDVSPQAGNVISDNQTHGVLLEFAANGNLVQGNTIGTDRTGTLAIANVGAGVRIFESDDNTIGGSIEGARNLLSGNTSNGIVITGNLQSSMRNQILGNYIGTDASGTTAVGNGTRGITIGIAAETTIGGIEPGAGNLISGNVKSGVILNPGGTTTRVLGNRVGTDAGGTNAIPNMATGIWIISDSSVVGGTTTGARNLVSGNVDDGIFVQVGAAQTIIQGNYVGTDITGTIAIGNTWGVEARATGTLIGGSEPGAGNLISGNDRDGVLIDNGNTGVIVQGNLIGTDYLGTGTLGNGVKGVAVLDSSDNLIGGTLPGARNIISANGQQGVFIQVDQGQANGNRVLGNYVGTDITGTEDFGNGWAGVTIIQGANNVVGGPEVGAGNLISGNSRYGVNISAGTGNTVQGNRIGTDITGTLAIPNDWDGVSLTDAAFDNLIGGSGSGAGNWISGNLENGVSIDLASTLNRVMGNRVGTELTGMAPLPNALAGVLLEDAFDNTIGGTAAGEGNVIAHNLAEGIVVTAASQRNAILANSILGNALLGIDLGPSDGVTENDPTDPDFGPNLLQNYPTIDPVAATPSGITVSGSLDSLPSSTFRIELFAGPLCDGTGHGQGARYLGTTDVVTDAAGQASIAVAWPAAVADGESVTATATDAAGNTSEFSACVTATCSTLVPLGETIVGTGPEVVWPTTGDVRWVKGDLAQVGNFATLADGWLEGVSSMDISGDAPDAGAGLYYLVKPLGCGSWRTTPGIEPPRDPYLP